MHNPVGRPNNARGEAFLNCANSRPCKITLVVISIIALSCAVTALVLAGHFSLASPLLTDILVYTGIGLAVVSVVLPIFITITSLTRRALDFNRAPNFVMPELYRYNRDEEKFYITVVQSDVRENPAQHLGALSRMISIQIGQRNTPNLKVQFHGQGGEDAGGLTKVYLDDLMQAFVSNEELFIINPISLYGMPKSTSEQQDVIFRQLGQLMMFCYPSLPLGRYIDPLVFKMALSMTADEVDMEYNQLTRARKLDLFKFITESRLNPEIAAENGLLNREEQTLDTDQQMLDLLGKEPMEWTHQQCMRIGTIVVLPEGYCNDDEMPVEAVVTDQVNRQILVDALWGFYEKRLGPDLRAIRAMAAGMKSICAKGNEQAFNEETQNNKWNATFVLNEVTTPQVFCEKLQGKIDRDYIANHIIYNGNNAEIQKKVTWMKEWILGNGEESIIIVGENREQQRCVLKATEKELREVLKFITGSSCLPEREGQHSINVSSLSLDNRSPYPRTHTCFNRIDLSPVPTRIPADNDHTKAAFIQSLMHAAIGSGGRVDNW